MQHEPPTKSQCELMTLAYGRRVAESEHWQDCAAHFWPHEPGTPIPEGKLCDCGHAAYVSRPVRAG